MKTVEEMRRVAAQGSKKAEAEAHKKFLQQERRRKKEERDMKASVKILIAEILKAMEKELRKKGGRKYVYSDIGRTSHTLYYRTAEALQKMGYDASFGINDHAHWVGDTESDCYEEPTKYEIVINL